MKNAVLSAIAFGSLIAANPALAAPLLSCADIQGTQLGGMQQGKTYFSVKEGDTVQVRFNDTKSIGYSLTTPTIAGAFYTENNTFPIVSDGAVSISVMGYFTVTCSSSSANDEALSSASTLSQSATIFSALRSTRGLTDGGSLEVTRNKAFGYSGDDASGWRVWGFTDFRRYSDAADGSSAGVTIGVDRALGDARVGALLSYDATTLDSGSGDETVNTLAIGPYISGTTSSFNYDAFVTYAKPEYSLTGGDLTGERISYGFTGEGSFDVGQTAIAPFFSLSGATEELDGDTLTTRKVSAGVRVDFGQIAGIDPYVSLAYEGTRQESALTGKTDHEAPRVGFGFTTDLASGAIVGVNVDAGENVEDLRDVGLNVSYSMTF
jgi:hypothetical protein